MAQQRVRDEQSERDYDQLQVFGDSGVLDARKLQDLQHLAIQAFEVNMAYFQAVTEILIKWPTQALALQQQATERAGRVREGSIQQPQAAGQQQ